MLDLHDRIMDKTGDCCMKDGICSFMRQSLVLGWGQGVAPIGANLRKKCTNIRIFTENKKNKTFMKIKKIHHNQSF